MEWFILFVIVGVIAHAVNKSKNNKLTYTDNSDADLSEFQITISTSSGYPSEQESKNTNPGEWIQPGKTIKVGSYNVKGGFFYSGGRLKSLDGYSTECSLIDPTLKIDSKLPDYRGDNVGYWPSYCHISPQSRAAYIEWLAGKRDNTDCYIGYVFLYFYGIERRLLIDGKDGGIPKSEHTALVKELERLKEVYGSNRSFNGYVTSLLAHVWVLYNSNNLPEDSLLVAKRNFTSVFKFLLGKTVANSKPISSDLALAWVRSHPEISLRTPARRCESEFAQLFKLRYKNEYGDGLLIKPNKTKLQLEYHPANSSLHGYQSVKLDLPDPSRSKAPVKKLLNLAESCTSELEGYSRFVGRPGNFKDSLPAIALLPNDLAVFIQNDEFSQLKDWIASRVTNSISVVPTEELLTQFGENAPLKINKKEAEMLANIIEKTGYGLAPDVRYHHAKPEISEHVVLFKNGHGLNFRPSHLFNQVGTILRLGAMVATIDDHVDNSEIFVLERLIFDDPELSTVEKKSLHAYLNWRLNTSKNLSGLKACLESISSKEKLAVSQILVTVALADGKIESSEIKQLEKLYSSLGLDKAMVSSDLHTLTAKKIKSLPDTTPINADSSSPSNFYLNRDLLRLHEKETKDVKAVLESIFVDENTIEEPKEIAVDISSTNNVSSLDDRHSCFYEKLICREQWSWEEVKAICKELNLMADGAIEVVNDWAFENVDAPLIDDGDAVFIDLEVANEIKSL